MATTHRCTRLLAFSLILSSLSFSAPAEDNYWTSGATFWDLATWTAGTPASGQRLFIGYDPYAFAGGTTYRMGNLSVGSIFSKNALTIVGGTLSLTSTSEVSTIDSTLSLSGGTLGGASNLNVAGLTTFAGGTLAGSGRLVANGGATISGSLALADTRTLENRGGMTWTAGTVSAATGTGVTNTAGSTFLANAASTWTGGSLTNAGTLNHNANTSIFTNVAVTNTGTIESSAGELRFVNPTAFINSGAVKASGTGRVTLQGGTYDVTGSGFSTSGTGTINFSGATVTGGLYAPWTVPSGTAGAIRLTNSTLNVADVRNSALLGFYGSNTLDGVKGDSGFKFLNGGTQTVKNGFTPGGAVTLDNGSLLSFSGDRSIGYDVIVQQAATNPSAGILASPGSTLTIGAGGSYTGTGGRINAGGSAFNFVNNATVSSTSALSIDVAGGSLANTGLIVSAPGVTGYGGASTLAVGAGSFLNSGTIRADGAAASLSLTGATGATFSNTGTFEAINGGSVGVFKNAEASGVAWSNAGTLRADGPGSRLYLGGTFTQTNLGNYAVTNGASAVVYAGTLNNAGATLNVGSANAWMLSNGGRILGGNIVGSGNLGFENIYVPSVLEDVSLDSGLNVVEGQVTLKGSTHLNGVTTLNGSSRLNFSDDVLVDHNIVAPTGAKIGMNKSGGTMTISSGVSLDGGLMLNGSFPTVTSFNLVNNGTVRNAIWMQGAITNAGLYEQTVDRQVIYNYGGLNNSGTLRASGTGNFYIGGDGAVVNTGTLAALGGGYFNLDGYSGGATPTNSGSVVIDPNSKISVTRNFAQTSTGLLTIGIGGSSVGLLTVGGNVTLDGRISVVLANGFTPIVGNTYSFLTYGGTLTGTLTTTDARWSVIYGVGTVSLRANPVPEPASLVAVGMGVLALRRRPRRRS